MSKRMIDSELIDSLGTDIKFDGTGNVIVGKNLEVGGTTKLNGGIKPIHIYQLDGITKLYVIFEDKDHDGSVPNDFMAYGWIERFGNGRPCMFYYALQNGKVNRFLGLSSDTIYEYSDNTMKTSKIAKASECQAKLYRHNIQLEDSQGHIIRFEYISPLNINVNSIENLSTITNDNNVIIDPQRQLVKAGGSFRVVGGADAYVVAAVSDTVTPL